MKGLALVIGAGGIGTQLAKDLNESEKDLDVVLCGRKSEFENDDFFFVTDKKFTESGSTCIFIHLGKKFNCLFHLLVNLI